MVRKALGVALAASWLGLGFTAQPLTVPPVIESISPTSGTIGTEIVIRGRGFTDNNDIAFPHPDIRWRESHTAYLNTIASLDGQTLRFTLPDILGACAFSQMKPWEACPDIGIGLPVGHIQIAVVNRNGTSNSVTFERLKSRREKVEKIIYSSPAYHKLSQILDEIVRRTGGSIGVGIRECNGRFCVVVWIEKDLPELSRQIPTTIEGFEVRVLPWAGELVEIRFTGTAEALQQSRAGASWWVVRVDKVISGPQPCVSSLRVITWTSAAPPVIWGSTDPNITPNDRVQVYGRYVEEADECFVTLMGSEQYFIRLPIEMTSAQIEIQPSSPTTEDEIAVTLTATFAREFGNSCFAGAQLALLKREDAETFSVTAGEVPPDLACILIYAPTKFGQYTHKLGKLPAGSYLFHLYDFEKLFLSRPFIVVVGTPIERALDRNGDKRIDDSEMLTAIQFWIAQEPVPGTGGQRISDAKMIELLNLWIKGRFIE